QSSLLGPYALHSTRLFVALTVNWSPVSSSSTGRLYFSEMKTLMMCAWSGPSRTSSGLIKPELYFRISMVFFLCYLLRLHSFHSQQTPPARKLHRCYVGPIKRNPARVKCADRQVGLCE